MITEMKELTSNTSNMSNIDQNEIIIKIATEADEIEQIHVLNYKTFVLEVQQHKDKVNSEGRLVDRFHNENTYLIAKKGSEVIAMLAIRGSRPFSLDEKIENLNDLLPDNCQHLCEVRLLAVKPEYRKGRTALRLLKNTLHYALNQGYNTALCSAKVDKINLYKYQGFKPFGPIIISGDAEFQPMYCRCEDLGSNHYELPSRATNVTYFLPGPVLCHQYVDEEFSKPPISHRSDKFMEDFKKLQRELCHLVNAQYVQLMTGSGTMANDVVAAQIGLMNKRGLILTNGEFGERLAKQAKAHRLEHLILKKPWGSPFTDKEIAEIIQKEGDIHWLWAVHCETSTGMLNDLLLLKHVAKQYQLKLCLDCISSVGAVPIDLSEVYLASGSSAKALGAMAGICFVFHNSVFDPQPNQLPSVLDLGYYIQNNGIPFTIPSKLIYVLIAALQHLDFENRLAKTKRFSTQIRAALKSLDIKPLISEAASSPAIVTIEIPPSVKSTQVGKAFEELGIYISFNSSYLQARNWVQFALMGNYTYKDIQHLINNLRLLKRD